MTGPSASGSENGKPSSTMSAPPLTAPSASSAAPDQAPQDQLLVELERLRERSRGPERGDDPFCLGQEGERGQSLLVARAGVLGRPCVAEERVLRAEARIVQARRDRVGIEHLAVVIGEQRGTRAVQNAGAAGPEAGRARGLDADEPNLDVLEEAGEEPDRVRAA